MPNRYPHTFNQVRGRLEDGPDCNLLSFGCSTGEEVAFLRSLYPLALIKGIDISVGRIRHCRRTLADERTQFAVASSAEMEPAGFYHAVFACAVFRHSDLSHGPPSCEGIISFAEFEAAIGHLVRCLRPGGYLVIRNANFRFADTARADEFDMIGEVEYAPDTPVYDPTHRLLPPMRYEASLFRRKDPQGSPVTPAP